MIDSTFILALASKEPTPGGGGASAYVGALAAALGSMVGNLTVGKKRYAAVEAEVYGSLDKLAKTRCRLIELVDEDARAFEPLAKAYGMPKATPEEQATKHAVMQEALIGACEVPLEIMRCCAEVIQECDFMAQHGSRLVLSDAGVAAVFAKAALQGASLNIIINAKDIADREKAQGYLSEMSLLIEKQGPVADAIYTFVVEEIG